MHNLSMQTPTPDQVIAARKAAGHSQTAAGQTIGVSLRTWQYYESDREMLAGLYELYLLRTGQHPDLVLVPRSPQD